MLALDGFDDRFMPELLSLVADDLGVVGGVDEITRPLNAVGTHLHEGDGDLRVMHAAPVIRQLMGMRPASATS